MIRALGYRLGRLRSISGRERLDLLTAQAALVRALALVRLRPVGALIRPAAAPPTAGGNVDTERLEALALAVERVAEHGLFSATCLVKAVALEHLLRSRRVPGAVVRIGVATGTGGLMAHAWIEIGGTVLGDRPENVRRYTTLSDFSALAS